MAQLKRKDTIAPYKSPYDEHFKVGIPTSGFHTGFFSRGGTVVCGKVDQLRP